MRVFDRDGNYLNYWFINNSQAAVPGMAIDPIADRIYVLNDNWMNFGGVYNTNGNFLALWGGITASAGGICVDRAKGNICVSDMSLNRIYILDSNGGLIAQWGETGSGDGQFNVARGICLNTALRRLYVVDRANQRVEYFNMH